MIEKYLKDTISRAWLEDYVKSYKINYVEKK